MMASHGLCKSDELFYVFDHNFLIAHALVCHMLCVRVCECVCVFVRARTLAFLRGCSFVRPVSVRPCMQGIVRESLRASVRAYPRVCPCVHVCRRPSVLPCVRPSVPVTKK